MESATVPPISDYERKWGKPQPGILHAIVQTRLTVFLSRFFPDKFEVLPELTLDTPGKDSTPDIALCELEPIDFSKDEIKKKDPPLATIEILSPTQILQTLLDKTNEYFSFGVKSCWVVLPTLQSIYVFSAPAKFEVFSHGDELYDPKLDIRMPIDTIFANRPVGG